MRVRDALDDLGDVVFLLGDGDAVLVHDEVARLGEGVVDDFLDLVVRQGVVDHFLTARVAVVSRGGVARVDGVELALDVRGEVVDPVDALDFRVSVGFEGFLFHDPFEEGFDLNVQAGVWGLVGDDAVDGAIGEADAGGEIREARGFGVFGVSDEGGEGVCSANGVFACNDSEGGGGFADVNSFGDDGGDESKDVGADRAGHLL